MHRLLAETAALESGSPRLSGEAERHLRVVRPKDGEEIELFDGRGRTRRFRWSAASKSLVADGETAVAKRPSTEITLFACITKGPRWDWTIQKATELGVSRIVPVVSARTIVRIAAPELEAKRERWLRIAEEAARQSDAVWLPEILPATGFAEALSLAAETTCFAGALVEPPPEPMLAAVEKHMPGMAKASLFVGPEGDFTPEELSALLKTAIPTSFGPTILRSETAAIFGLSVLVAAARAS